LDQLILVKERDSFLGSLFIAIDDLAGVQSHLDQVLCVAQQFPREGYCEIGRVSAFLFLHFAGQYQHLGGGVLHFELHGWGGTSLRMVAASEVTKVLSMWLTTIFLRAEIILKRFKNI
jgi:hypothetical protein